MTTWIETDKTTTSATYSLLIDDANHKLLIDSTHFLLLQDEDQGTQWSETSKT